MEEKFYTRSKDKGVCSILYKMVFRQKYIKFVFNRMASSSDITEVKRFIVSNVLCVNCSEGCVGLYENSKFKCGGLRGSEITEMKRLILSNMLCVICMSSQNVSKL